MLELLLPRRCVRCGTPSAGLCPECAALLPPAPDLGPPPGMAACWSLLDHDDVGREVVVAMKYHGRLDAVPLLARAMAELVDRPVALVTWAPTSSVRRRRRGFDQAELLARAVARASGRRCRPLLRRTSSTPQSGHGRADRMAGPRFEPRRPPVPPGTILVVDDVRTTGATLCAAAEALAGAGHRQVVGLTLSARR